MSTEYRVPKKLYFPMDNHLMDNHQSIYLTKLEGNNPKEKNPVHEAIFSHLEISEPSFSL